MVVVMMMGPSSSTSKKKIRTLLPELDEGLGGCRFISAYPFFCVCVWQSQSRRATGLDVLRKGFVVNLSSSSGLCFSRGWHYFMTRGVDVCRCLVMELILELGIMMFWRWDEMRRDEQVRQVWRGVWLILFMCVCRTVVCRSMCRRIIQLSRQEGYLRPYVWRR